jgi:hypothetical protein
MNRRVRWLLVLGALALLVVRAPFWIVSMSANAGNLYMVRGIVGDQATVGPWVHARIWLNWAAQRLEAIPTERLRRRIERVDAFVGRYAGDGLSELSATPPVPPYAPEYQVDESIEEWVLLGYDLDERSLELENRANMWLYWQSRDGTIVTQRIQTENLVFNGGFEQTADVGGDMPLGFVRERYSRYVPPFTHRRIVVKTRQGLPTLCAQLDNRQGSVPSGYLSHEFARDGHAYYLVGGWVVGNHEGVNVGLLNLGTGIPDEQRNSVVPPAMSEHEWTYYTGVLALSPNTTALCAQLYYLGTGVVCFDNVLVVSLELPIDD